MPPHFLTALKLPMSLEHDGAHEGGSQQRQIMLPIGAIAILIAVLAIWYLLREMNKAKPEVVYQRRKAR